MIFDHFGVGTHEAILDKLRSVQRKTFQGDDGQGFDARRDEVSLSIRKVPPDDMLDSVKKNAHT